MIKTIYIFKNYFYFAIILLFTFSINSCSSDDTQGVQQEEEEEIPVEEVYFTLNTTNYVEQMNIQDWIITHNSNGDLLDSNLITSNQLIEFKKFDTELTDKISITFFKFWDNGGGKHYIKTYTNINKAETWQYFLEQTSTSNGTFNLLVNHPSNYNSISCNTDGYSYNYGNSTNSNSTQLTNLKLFDNNPYYLSALDPNYGWKYKILDNISSGSNLVVNHTELQDYDSYLNINLPQVNNASVYYSVSVFDESHDGVGARIMRGDSNNDDYYPNTLKIGYLNQFSKFITYISYGTYEYHYIYKKYGAKPNEINIPNQPVINITNQQINNFQLTSNIDYQYKKAYWDYSSGSGSNFTLTTWEVFSTNDEYSIGDIPQVIVDLYPTANINSLEYFNSVLIKTDSYSNFINREFISGLNNNDDFMIETFEVY